MTPTASIDILVSGVGTGGTITGAQKSSSAAIRSFKSIAVEPVNSPVITQKGGAEIRSSPAGIPSKASALVSFPMCLNVDIIDEVVR